MGTPAPAQGMPAPQGGDQNAMLAALLQGLQGGQAGYQTAGSHDPMAPPQQGAQPQGGPQDPWIQMQQQALNSANSQWGQLQNSQASPYQVAPDASLPQRNAQGGYDSGDDWVKAQAAAQAHSDATYGKAPGMTGMLYKAGDNGPYSPVGDLAANQYVARADQWAANGSGPAIAPAIQQAINEDPRLSDLYSNQPIQRINNVGNGFGALPGALTPGVALHNAGQIPAAYNDLLKRTASNPGSPQGMANLGPNVAQYMSANPVANKGLDIMGRPLTTAQSFYDYSSPNGSPANSAGAQQVNAQRQEASGMTPQLQMLIQLLMGGQQSSAPGMSTMRSTGTPQPQVSPAGGQMPSGNPLLNRSAAAMQMLGR